MSDDTTEFTLLRAEPKPGVKTSELWVTLTVLMAATLLAALGRIDADLWAFVAVGSSASYGVSRGLAKRR